MTPRAAVERGVDVALWLGVAFGFCARIVRYLDARSLWGDEAQLALNLMKRDAAALWGPLDMAQSAPYGFLWLERAVLETFGAGELALRAAPLLASLLALPLFAFAARRLLPRRDALVALFLFATSEPLVFYASELKQYSFDVLVALGLLALALPRLLGDASDRAPSPAAQAAWLALAGALGVWFSFPAVFVLAAIGIALVATAWERAELDAPALARLAAVAVAWALSFAAAFAAQGDAALRDPYLQEFWADAFAPFPPSSAQDFLWYPKTLLGFFSDPLGLPPAWPALLVAAAGALHFGRTRPVALWLLLGAPVFALCASMAGLFPLRTWPGVDIRDGVFPFVGRLWLFAVPAALLLIAGGLAWLRAQSRSAGEALALAALLVVAAPALRQAVANAFEPPRIQEFRPVAEAMREKLEPEDRVWIQRGSEPVFEYYARRLGLRVAARNVGAIEADYRQAFERDVAGLAPGDRVWLVSMSHPAWNTAAGRDALVGGLERRAARTLELEAKGAAAILFRVPD